MEELQVRIVRVAPMRVATVQAIGASPETDAWNKLMAWARPKGLDDLKAHRIFGFNDPMPSAESQEYGYRYWLTVGPETASDDQVEVKDFSGGQYAVTRCEVRGDPVQAIPSTWEQLAQWSEKSGHKMGSHQWLEEHLTPPDSPSAEWDMDLYLPIQD